MVGLIFFVYMAFSGASVNKAVWPLFLPPIVLTTHHLSCQRNKIFYALATREAEFRIPGKSALFSLFFWQVFTQISPPKSEKKNSFSSIFLETVQNIWQIF